MSRKVVLISDPGIDGAFAVALALHDPELQVLGIAAAAGNVPAETATRNVQVLVEQFDPPRLPRIGAALTVEYDIDGSKLHGPGGLGGITMPLVRLHHPIPSDRLLVDLIREYPHEVTVIAMGPLTVLARAMDHDPELHTLVQRLVCVGGTWHEPGNAGPMSEFHFYCDPMSAHNVIQSSMPTTLIPLDVTRRLTFSPRDLLDLPAPDSTTCRFLRQIIPHGIRMSSNVYGIEGFHMKDVLGVVAASDPSVLTTKSFPVAVEAWGELTRGVCVIDARLDHKSKANVDLAVSVDMQKVRDYIWRILEKTEQTGSSTAESGD